MSAESHDKSHKEPQEAYSIEMCGKSVTLRGHSTYQCTAKTEAREDFGRERGWKRALKSKDLDGQEVGRGEWARGHGMDKELRGSCFPGPVSDGSHCSHPVGVR